MAPPAQAKANAALSAVKIFAAREPLFEVM